MRCFYPYCYSILKLSTLLLKNLAYYNEICYNMVSKRKRKVMIIAKTIQNQLIQTLGQGVLWSWGQTALQSLTAEDLNGLNINNGEGALKFKVNGHHHKGHVLVVLNGADTYDVYICSIHNSLMTIKDEARGLYFDEFGKWIDEKVEYVEEYAS